MQGERGDRRGRSTSRWAHRTQHCAKRLAAVVALGVIVACGAAPPPPPPPPPPVLPDPIPEKVQLSDWKVLSPLLGVMVPKDGFPDANVDLVIHFHTGQSAEADFKDAGLPAAILGVHCGQGSTAYREPFQKESKLRDVIDQGLRAVEKEAHAGEGTLKLRRLILTAWSAGYGAVAEILKQPVSYAMVDAVILLDGLHTDYTDPGFPGYLPDGGLARRAMDTTKLAPFVLYAKDAAAKRKLFVMTHSTIIPGPYVSTVESSDYLIEQVGTERILEDDLGPHGDVGYSRADLGDFHIRGFKGDTKDAHNAQLHLVGYALDTFVRPRWAELGRRAAAR